MHDAPVQNPSVDEKAQRLHVGPSHMPRPKGSRKHWQRPPTHCPLTHVTVFGTHDTVALKVHEGYAAKASPVPAAH